MDCYGVSLHVFFYDFLQNYLFLFYFLILNWLKITITIIVLKPGPAGRPRPGLSKKQAGNWPGETRSTRRVDPGPGRPGQTRLRPGFIYIYSWPKWCHFQLLQLKCQIPKQEEQRNEHSVEDPIDFKPNSRNLQTHFSREEEQRSRRPLNSWSLFQIQE